MSMLEAMCQTIGIVRPRNLSNEEALFLEADIFSHVYDSLKNFFKAQYINYFNVMKFNLEMENTMLENNFMRYLINDILLSEAYSLTGIAYYTQTPEEVIYDLATGLNIHPSLPLSRKIINLHRDIRPDLYRDIFKKFQENLPVS